MDGSDNADFAGISNFTGIGPYFSTMMAAPSQGSRQREEPEPRY
jgi:hypothetical protein